jgi:hypothetical protein
LFSSQIFLFSEKHQVIFRKILSHLFVFSHYPCGYQILLVLQPIQSLDNIKPFFVFQTFFILIDSVGQLSSLARSVSWAGAGEPSGGAATWARVRQTGEAGTPGGPSDGPNSPSPRVMNCVCVCVCVCV